MKRLASNGDGFGGLVPMAPEGVEMVSLDALEPQTDASEISKQQMSDPTADSPGDNAILEQEELYEGISSDIAPSKRRRDES
ncbi:MAG: hypothetical protein ACREKE_07345 [bacterium]